MPFKCCKSIYVTIKKLESAVDIATSYGLDDRGVWVRVPAKKGNIFKIALWIYLRYTYNNNLLEW
jgi:hypothetical protein